MKKILALLFLVIFICCSFKKNSFDFWAFSGINDLKKSLIIETPIKSNYVDIENFLRKNISFFDNSKILKDNKNSSFFITLILVKENFFKFLLKRPNYYSALVVIYKFDSEKKLLDIDIDGVYP